MIIGLIGRRGSGKDTLADHLVATRGFKNRKFAGPLKDAVKVLFDLDDEHMEGVHKEQTHPLWGVSPRVMMQFFGTEIMQKQIQTIMPDLGFRHAITRMFMAIDRDTSHASTVVSDVRFAHEVEALLSRGALIIHVKRDVERSSPSDTHVSESGIDDLFSHHVIDNNGLLQTSFDNLESLISRHQMQGAINSS